MKLMGRLFSAEEPWQRRFHSRCMQGQRWTELNVCNFSDWNSVWDQWMAIEGLSTCFTPVKKPARLLINVLYDVMTTLSYWCPPRFDFVSNGSHPHSVHFSQPWISFLLNPHWLFPPEQQVRMMNKSTFPRLGDDPGYVCANICKCVCRLVVYGRFTPRSGGRQGAGSGWAWPGHRPRPPVAAAAGSQWAEDLESLSQSCPDAGFHRRAAATVSEGGGKQIGDGPGLSPAEGAGHGAACSHSHRGSYYARRGASWRTNDTGSPHGFIWLKAAPATRPHHLLQSGSSFFMASPQQSRIQSYLERNKIGPLFQVSAPERNSMEVPGRRGGLESSFIFAADRLNVLFFYLYLPDDERTSAIWGPGQSLTPPYPPSLTQWI